MLRHNGPAPEGAAGGAGIGFAGERRADTTKTLSAATRTTWGELPQRPGQPRERRLTAEYRSLVAAAMRNVRELRRYGVPENAIAVAGPVPAQIALDRTGEFYHLDDTGKAAWVLPVCCVDPERPEVIEAPEPLRAIGYRPPIDLLAFHPDAPGRFALRLGNATVLGAIEPQYLDPDPVAVHRDVTDWLRVGCNGIVLLTRHPAEAGRILRQCLAIAAEDEAHADELRRALTPPAPKWPIVTARPRDAR